MPDSHDTQSEFLKQRNVKPPERFTHLTEEELRQRLAEQKANHVCSWQQSGSEIFCDSGDFRHGKRIGVNEMLAEPFSASPRLIKKQERLRKAS